VNLKNETGGKGRAKTKVVNPEERNRREWMRVTQREIREGKDKGSEL
jgi:hypothetical protein